MAEMQKRSNKALYLLLILALILIGLAAWDLLAVARNSTHDTEFLSLAGQQSLLSQTMARSADQAVAGKNDAFQALLTARDQFDCSINLMGNGDPQTLMPAASGDVLSEVNVLQGQWNQVSSAVQTILAAHDSILVAKYRRRKAYNKATPGLIQAWDGFTDELAKRGTGHNALVYAARAALLRSIIERDVNLLVTGGHLEDVSFRDAGIARHHSKLHPYHQRHAGTAMCSLALLQ